VEPVQDSDLDTSFHRQWHVGVPPTPWMVPGAFPEDLKDVVRGEFINHESRNTLNKKAFVKPVEHRHWATLVGGILTSHWAWFCLKFRGSQGHPPHRIFEPSHG
jgi:hypothetical protein